MALSLPVTQKYGYFMLKFSPAFALALIVFADSACFAASTRATQSRLFSQTSIEKGWQQATQRQQPMLVMFTSESCRYCKKMLAETYGHPAIQRMLADQTQTVLAHADDYPALVKKLGIRGYPSSVLVSPQGDVLEFVEGFVSPKDFAKRIRPILKGSARQARTNSLSQQTAGR